MKYVGTGTVIKKTPKWLVVVLAFFFGEFGLHDLVIREYKKTVAHFLLFLIPTLLFGYRFAFPDSLFRSLNHWAWIYTVLLLANWIWAIIEAAKYDQSGPVVTKNKKSLNNEALNKADKKFLAVVSKIKMARVVTYVNIVITAPIWLTLLMKSMGLPPSLGLLSGGGGVAIMAFVLFPILLIASIVLFVMSLIPFFLVSSKNKSNELVSLEFNRFKSTFFIQILLIAFVVIYFISFLNN